ncbi:MAG: formylglycine-generating enzyme family protein [Puniceicoccales bacterium]|nr:formylglycine-generating enzyme family protein [Puniceicoccales bacterium]
MLPVPAGSVAIILEGEHARREVRVPHPFWLGKYEVTQEQYKAVTGDNPSQNKGDNLPVENLRWEDAVEFCRRLTEQERERGNLPEGYVYGLPTEDEWLFAATAGGDDKNAKGWDAKNSAGRTHAVGTQPPNAWGFYDMAGNVGEMCADNAVGNLSPGAPLRPLDTHDRIVRGSTINTRAQSSLHRDAISKNEANPATGFRLALRRIS